MTKKTTIFILFYGFCMHGFSQNFDNFIWHIYDTASGSIQNNLVNDIEFDSKGNTWVTTGGFGLSKYDGKRWSSISVPGNPKNGMLNDIEIDKAGKLFITGYTGYLLTYDPVLSHWDSFPSHGGVQLWAMNKNQKGVYLIGSTASDSGKLFQFVNGKFEMIENMLGDPFGITIEPNGDALVSFRKGLYRYKMLLNGGYAKGGEKLSDRAYYETSLDSKGNIWAASYTGAHLFSYNGKEWAEFEDLPESIYYSFNGEWKYCIHNVLSLKDDRVLISTQFGCHLAIYNGKKWKTYRIPVSKKDDGIGRIRIGPDGSLWCATGQSGIAVFCPKK